MVKKEIRSISSSAASRSKASSGHFFGSSLLPARILRKAEKGLHSASTVRVEIDGLSLQIARLEIDTSIHSTNTIHTCTHTPSHTDFHPNQLVDSFILYSPPLFYNFLLTCCISANSSPSPTPPPHRKRREDKDIIESFCFNFSLGLPLQKLLAFNYGL